MYPLFRNLIPYVGGVLACALIPSLDAQTIKFQPVAPDVLAQRLKGATGTNQEREQALKKLFEEAGCKQIAEPAVKGAETPNITCTLPGTEKAAIVVGAHYDKPSKGDGVIGDWAGAALLPSLYESLSQTPRRLTLVFVGFTDQQKGLRGSKAFVKDGGQGPDNVKAMLNIDCVGLDATEIWTAHSEKNLVANLSRVAQSLKAPLTGMDRKDYTEVDSQPFADKKIPTIDFHSLRQDTVDVPESNKDKASLVKMDEYANTLRLVSGYIAFLDSASGMPPAAGK